MKKLVTTLTASALLMGSLATAVSAAETPATPTVTDTTYTPGTVGGTVVGSTNPNAMGSFQSTNNAFYFTRPATWNDKVDYEEFTAAQLTSMNENGIYLAKFTYQPQFTTKAGNTLPVEFASVRAYTKSAWDALVNKSELGTILSQTDDGVYVLEIENNSDQLVDETDLNAFNALKADFLNTVPKTFGLGVAPVVTNPTPGTTSPTIPNDPSKVSTNPTPNIELTSMTPFYKSPGGTMIGYLGPQKLDTTGNGTTDPASGQWVEIYTWMGLAWIVVE